MSVNNSSDCGESDEVNDEQVFVDLLAKYKINLGKPTEKVPCSMDNLLIELANELNQKCQSKFTPRKILYKIQRTKYKLKTKHYKNLARSKQLPYLEWEQKFLDLWVGHNITVTKTSKPSKKRLKLQHETVGEMSPNNCDPKSKSESQYAEDEEYGALSWAELKRGVLITRLEKNAAEEAAFKAKEKLKLFKLSLLQRIKVQNDD